MNALCVIFIDYYRQMHVDLHCTQNLLGLTNFTKNAKICNEQVSALQVIILLTVSFNQWGNQSTVPLIKVFSEENLTICSIAVITFYLLRPY
jgi:hypothetical protein